MAIQALSDIEPEEEILVNYQMGMAEAPLWYKELWVKHLRRERGMCDKEILDWCGRQYSMNGRVIELPL